MTDLPTSSDPSSEPPHAVASFIPSIPFDATGAHSRMFLRNMFSDVRMLAYDTGLMNPLAKIMWKICKIDGVPSRYRCEPPRDHLPSVEPTACSATG